MRQKRIMVCFSEQKEWFSFALKCQAGFGKGGEKNFEGTVTALQMGGYLLIRDFRQRINKKDFPYGWPISVYTTPGGPVGLSPHRLRLFCGPGGIQGFDL